MEFECITNTKPAKSSNRGKTPIVANVDIWSIISITEVSRIFRVNYQLTMIWQDRRLKFFNLKNESHLNMVGLNESLAIWYPISVFQNTLSRDKSKVTEYELSIDYDRLHKIFYTHLPA